MIVKFSFGYTHNLGNYQSVKVEIGYEEECNKKGKDDLIEDMRKDCEEKVLYSIEKFAKKIKRLQTRKD
jgi:hypothetical protein